MTGDNAMSTTAQFLCTADPDRMFPPDEAETGPPSPGEWSALAVCARCPSLWPCRAWAFSSRLPHGVVGGTTSAQRRARRRSNVLRRTTLQDVLLRQNVACEADPFVVEELVIGRRGLKASPWEVALAAVVLVESGRPKLEICRQLEVHPRQLYRWLTRYQEFRPLIPASPRPAPNRKAR